MIAAWKAGDDSTPKNLPARLMWFHERIKAGESPAICRVAPFVEAATEIENLRMEVEVLRSYGNKDCTAMADAALEQKRTTGKGPWED